MAVSTVHTKDILMGDGLNTKFPFTFQVIEKEQVQCLKVLTTGEEYEVLKTEIDIKLNDGGTNGGEITYPLIGNPLEEGCKFIIFRQTEIKQDYTPPNGQVFDAVAIKNEIDRLTMQNQEQEETLQRSVKVTISDTQSPEELLAEVYNKLDSASEIANMAIGAADSATNAANKAAAAVDSAEKTLRDVNQYVNEAKIIITETKNEALTASETAVAAIETNVSKAKLDIDETVLTAKNTVDVQVSNAGNIIDDKVSKAAKAIDEVKSDVLATSATAVASIETNVSSAKLDIEEAVSSAKNDITSIKTAAIDAVEKTKTDAENNVEITVQTAKDSIGQTISAAVEDVKEQAIGAAQEAITSAADTATSIATANLNTYVESTSKPLIEQYVISTTQPEIDEYVENEVKPNIDAHAGSKQDKLTADQLEAVNSGVTKDKVTIFSNHLENIANPHNVTKVQVGLNNVDNTSDRDKPVSLAVEAALNTKQAIINLTPSRAVVSDVNGKIGVSDVTATEISYLSGVTSAIQAQLDNKATSTTIANFQPPLTVLTQTSGTVTLAINKIYSLSISGATTFTLPTPANKNVFNQIKVMLKVTGTPTIMWGTFQFFNKATPEIEAGSYDVYFDYDNLIGAWVCGAMPKGAAS